MPIGRTKLSGLRVLVVEDEALIAWDIAEHLRKYGVKIVGPAATVTEACALLEGGAPDAAVLDINLRHESVYPLIEKLRMRRIPFVFASGYSRSALPAEYAGCTFIEKPFDGAAFMEALATSFCRAREA